MNGQEFYEEYYQRIRNAKTSKELSNIQKELLDFLMQACENEQYSEYGSYVSTLLSFFNDKAFDTITDEVHSKHR